MMSSHLVVKVHPLSCYSFGRKEAKVDKDVFLSDRLNRMRANFMRDGLRTYVEGLLLPEIVHARILSSERLTRPRQRRTTNKLEPYFDVHEYGHPHLLLLQKGNKIIRLPGGRLRPGENEIEGLKRKLTSKLCSSSSSGQSDWQIGECVGVWWRPNFETLMYPYCPPHINKPKECKKIYVVHLSENQCFEVPKNLKILAVPLFELFDNVEKYGPEISSIPQQLSRFSFDLV